MGWQLAEVVACLHQALREEIDLVTDCGDHSPISCSEYVEGRLLRSQRRYIAPLSATPKDLARLEAADTFSAEWLQDVNQSCDFGKLRDVQMVFTRFDAVIHRRAQIANAITAKDGAAAGTGPQAKPVAAVAAGIKASRVQSAPVAPMAALSRMQLGLDDRSGTGAVVGITTTGGALAPSNGDHGIPERQFIKLLAPVLAPTFPRGIAPWYNSIDTDGTGTVTWKKFLRYLQTLCENVRTEAKRFESVSEHYRYDEIPLRHLQPSQHYHVLQVQQSKDSFFVRCSDGAVRQVSKETHQVTDVVHYHDEEYPPPVDVKFCAERNQLFVALSNGFTFVYDTSGHLTRQGNILRIFRLGQPTPFSERGWNPTQGVATMAKMTKFDPLHMPLPNVGRRFLELPKAVVTNCDVFPLGTCGTCTCVQAVCRCRPTRFIPKGQLCAVEPLIEQQYSGNSKDPTFFAGFESGHVALYRPPMVCSTVLGPRPAVMVAHPFSARVTALRHCHTFSDLRGLLVSSDAGHLSLLDLETSDVVMTFRDEKHSDQLALSDGGGWVDGVRPVHQFDVSSQLPLVASCGRMRGISLWSATMRRKIASFNDHRGSVVSLAFHQSVYQLLSVGADRTVRVWDVRTLKPLQVIPDRERLDGQPYSAICYDSAHDSVLAWSGAPYKYRMLDDNIASETATDLLPISAVQLVDDDSASHTAVAAGSNLSLWRTDTGELEIIIDTHDPVLGITQDSIGKKVYIILGSNVIGQYVIGSHVLSTRKTVAQCDKIFCLSFLARHSWSSQLPSADSSNESPRLDRPTKDTTGDPKGGEVRGGSFTGFLVAGCAGGKVMLIPDRFSLGAAASPVIHASCTVSISACLVPDVPNGQASPEITGDVTSIEIVSSLSTVVVATANGYMVVFGVEAEGLVYRKHLRVVSVLAAMVANLATVSPKQRRSESAPLQKTGALWKKAVQVAVQREAALKASEFTRFRYTAQEEMQVYVESVAFLQGFDHVSTSTTPRPASCGFDSPRSGSGARMEVTPRARNLPGATPRRIRSNFLVASHANGDVRILKAVLTSKTADDDALPMECVACFPGSSMDGCGSLCAGTTDGTFWVADDGGYLMEYHALLDEAAGAAFAEMRSGPKFHCRIPVTLEHVWKFSSGINALVVKLSARPVIALGLEGGRPVVVDIATRDIIWGQSSVDSSCTAKENLLKHRFNFAFPDAAAAKRKHKALLPRFANAVSKLMALRPKTRAQPPPPPTPFQAVSEDTRESYLRLVMRGAPAHLRDGVLRRDTLEEEVPQSKADKLLFRSRSANVSAHAGCADGKAANGRLHESCFHWLTLNDVTKVLHTAPLLSRRAASVADD